ncbi:glutathione S-transferase N-terminal domain-containing protein [Achromobacter spanius]|uniref:Glutathione S-transferase N-terminal domain-containing protein n=1 Tax=Achromobacter spanius TaxID=217203 RepID=A0AA42LU61_9BURK|nr:glutathione S-transferase N-terminal domain-containing protein [Achromobacter spanius]MDH0739662.1 glutathione S-transferase N-terminal domain-containing protein [Achromobacter spanius]
MKLHWSPRSPFVRKVMIVLYETGIEGQVELVRTPVAMDKPNLDLVADNPLIKLPTLVLDDGTVLYDSRVICAYLNGLAGGRLLPADAAARLVAERRQALGDGFLDALLLFRQERNKPVEKQTVAWLDAFALKVRAVLAALEAEAPALAASDFDLGVIAIGCALSYMDYRFPDIDWRAGHPQLAAWHQGFCARPSVARSQPDETP